MKKLNFKIKNVKLRTFKAKIIGKLLKPCKCGSETIHKQTTETNGIFLTCLSCGYKQKPFKNKRDMIIDWGIDPIITDKILYLACKE